MYGIIIQNPCKQNNKCAWPFNPSIRRYIHSLFKRCKQISDVDNQHYYFTLIQYLYIKVNKKKVRDNQIIRQTYMLIKLININTHTHKHTAE